jgi:arsenate reductase
MRKPAVLFLCTNNAVRSQMAEALFKMRTGGKFEAYSAGTEPKEIHPLTIRVMDEVGVDLSDKHAKGLRELLGHLPVEYAVFVCQSAEEKCPVNWPGAIHRLEWPFEDPAAYQGSEDERLAKFRSVRNQIAATVDRWVDELALTH